MPTPGASGSKRGSDDWEIAYKFAASPNRSNFSVGDITGISKKGWEYMWVRYEDAEDAAAKAIVKKPVAVYVEKVYEEGNFASLGDRNMTHAREKPEWLLTPPLQAGTILQNCVQP